MENTIEIKYSNHEKGILLGSERNFYRLAGKYTIFSFLSLLVMLYFAHEALFIPYLKIFPVTIFVIISSILGLIFILDGGGFWKYTFGIIVSVCWLSYFNDAELKDYHFFKYLISPFSELKNYLIEVYNSFYYYSMNILWYFFVCSSTFFCLRSYFLLITDEKEASEEFSFNSLDSIYVKNAVFIIESSRRYKIFFKKKFFRTINFYSIREHDFGDGKYLYLSYLGKDLESGDSIKEYKIKFSRKVDASTRSFLTHQIMKAQSVDKEN